MSNFKEELRKVKTFVFDVDGVLSTQTIPMDAEGEPMRSINVRDGYAIKLAVNKGYRVGIISGGRSEAVRLRYEGLGVTDIYLDSRYKKNDLEDYIGKYDLDPKTILYMGDDIPDLEAMEMVGFPTCPSDAVTEVKQISRYISHFRGGEGCARDVIEQVLRLHNHWMNGEAFGW
ncbi:MAG TPA: 3-deoxy-D-manno-octulosonate 8-phosphate phosphatase [Bacteroidetes bacterium]|nr:3-deoxy-D-manno-octulosonate 8-phosphate phosphatase [Bacteroidota bacterium]